MNDGNPQTGAAAPHRLGRYLLLKLLGAGGMAEIHLARHVGIEGFRKLLVIKRIHKYLALDPRFVEMFFDEARIAARLNHPNIVQIFDLGRVDGYPFIAMEYVEGAAVRDVLVRAAEQSAPMPWPIVAWVGARACEGLAHAHALTDEQGEPLGLVHRDISPHNLLLSYDGMVKLVDFGIARATARIEQTQSHSRKGKLGYMSPEQLMGMPLDQRSDIFSLGVVMWEMLANARLFDGRGEMELMQQTTAGSIPDPVVPGSPVPPALVAAVRRALALEPDDRFASAVELGEALDDAVAHEADRTPNAKRLAEYLGELYGADVARARAEVRHLLSLDVTREASSSLEAEARAQTGDLELVGPPRVAQRSRPGLGGFLFGFGGAAFAILVMLALVFSGVLTATRQAAREPARAERPPVPAPMTPLAIPNSPSDNEAAGVSTVALTLSSSPNGAMVRLDGVPLGGRTPLTIDRPAGRYRIEMSKSGFVPAQKTVELRNSQPRALQLTLKKARTKPMGRLTFNTHPWSIVVIGSRRFETPLFKERLPAGRHTLRVLREGKGPALRVQVTIPAGDELTLPTMDL